MARAWCWRRSRGAPRARRHLGDEIAIDIESIGDARLQLERLPELNASIDTRQGRTCARTNTRTRRPVHWSTESGALQVLRISSSLQPAEMELDDRVRISAARSIWPSGVAENARDPPGPILAHDVPERRSPRAGSRSSATPKAPTRQKGLRWHRARRGVGHVRTQWQWREEMERLSCVPPARGRAMRDG